MNEKRLQRVWYGGESPGPLLGALESMYRWVSSARARRGASQQPEALLDRPIVVVGNITVGGTGKTPLIIRLAEILHGNGLKVAVISRGYGRASRGPQTVNKDSSAEDVGDEPLLIARRGHARVLVDEDREMAALKAFDEGADVVLSDDGLQRAQLPRMLELCVVDGSRGFGNGRLLPAGPLREPVTRLDTVDHVFCNGSSGHSDEIPDDTVPMKIVPTIFRRLNGSEPGPAASAASALKDQVPLAVAGMGNPERFFNTLRELGIEEFETRIFPDHHVFSSEDLADCGDDLILMTEKDAVKCENLGLTNAWVLEVKAELPSSWELKWLRQVEKLINK